MLECLPAPSGPTSALAPSESASWPLTARYPRMKRSPILRASAMTTTVLLRSTPRTDRTVSSGLHLDHPAVRSLWILRRRERVHPDQRDQELVDLAARLRESLAERVD